MARKKSQSKKAVEKDDATDLLTQLSELGEGGVTGTLHVDRPSAASVDVHLMMGSIIAAGSKDDDKTLGNLLIASGAVDADAFEMITMDIKGDEDLADLLVQAGSVDGGAMMAARSGVFRDNLAWALGTPGATGAFEELDAVFPDNMQLGVDRDELLLELSDWRDAAAPVMAMLSDEQTHAAVGDQPSDCADAVWAELHTPRPVTDLLDVIGPPFINASRSLSAWLDAEAIGPVEESDYDKAARGGFVKSYEVLDKVDLQGVAILGADAHTPPSAPSMEAIEAIAMDEDFDDEDEPTEAIPKAFLDTRPETPVLAVTQPGVETPTGELGSGDFDIFGSTDEDSADNAAVVDADGTGSIRISGTQGPFTREQLNDFEDRIKVFNNIFRVIFATFAEHITADKSQQRFNALLGSGQRQYPELFRDLSVGDDGTVPTQPLINNLAECPPGDYGALLHQGLYELIFSHLYDAKDMLPGEAESEMMERIVIYERQLHQM
ncbi:MAG: hypothetical protein GY898_18880 [Proteobacteria bacterium]|nr:hypothetical protein [Pseudomonadota bacterium]